MTRFTDVRKALYLNAIVEHGYDHVAAEGAGVTIGTIRHHRKIDPEFAEAEKLALTIRSQNVMIRLEREALEGHKEMMFDKENRPVKYTDAEGKEQFAYKLKYETPLRGMMMKRHDERYREKVDVEVSAKGGVLVVPQPVADETGWAALVAAATQARRTEPTK